MNTETIAAIATPPGYGGVGIIRISGSQAVSIAESICSSLPSPRYAGFRQFTDKQDKLIDEGIVLYFPAPHSFTGEDVVELQGHGGPVVLDMMLQEVLHHGARVARPGEFSERAFHNDKLDLAQAEAIADLIDSTSHHAARLAVRSLKGEFSDRIHQLVDHVVHFRVYIEAALDFPDEDIDFIADKKVEQDLSALIKELNLLLKQATRGKLLRDGITMVIAGKPNAGKSSLMNKMAGDDVAIVTDIAGTTRDLLHERIQIDGLPIHIIDTAGLRETDNPVEQAGINRTKDASHTADILMWVYDAQQPEDALAYQELELEKDIPVISVCNKIDLLDSDQHKVMNNAVSVSAVSGEGLTDLYLRIKQQAGLEDQQEGEFLARRRHLDALERASNHLADAQNVLLATYSGDLVADDLRLVQNALGEITGVFKADDLLGEIFSNFCIGK